MLIKNILVELLKSIGTDLLKIILKKIKGCK